VSDSGVTSVAIIVCTRDRPDDLARCLASLLSARLPGSPIVIVDQSRGDESQALVRALMDEHDGVDYVRSKRSGAATARNEGSVRVEEDLLLYADDDCEVAPDWAKAWSAVFDEDPNIGLAFGRVIAPEYDTSAGIIPTFDPGPVVTTLGPEIFRQRLVNLGMGANMAMRRSVWQQVGGFDDHFGPGTDLPAGEEGDLVVRVLDRGYEIAHAPTAEVLHHGFREGSAAGKLLLGYCLAGGAMFGKHIRLGDRRAIVWALREVWVLGLSTTRAVLTGRRPTGFNCLRYFVKGLMVSMRKPIDRTRRMYAPVSNFASPEDPTVPSSGLSART
jgi:GT2 family glycosyltransferase